MKWETCFCTHLITSTSASTDGGPEADPAKICISPEADAVALTAQMGHWK